MTLPALAALAVVASSASPSPVLSGTSHAFDVRASETAGTRADTAEVESFHRSGLWLEWRTGITEDRRPTWGWLGSVSAGMTSAGSLVEPEGARRFALTARGGLAGRAFTWTSPYAGTLVVHARWELAFGDSTWWEDGARSSVLAGLRVLFGHGGPIRGMADYTFVPLQLGGPPDGLREVGRLEHRARFSVLLGLVGAGVAATYGTVRALPDEGGWRSVEDLGVSAFVELRLPDAGGETGDDAGGDE